MPTIFEFTREISDDFYKVAAEIENLLYEQPSATLMKSRLYCEQLVKMVSEKEELEKVYPLKNADRIHRLYRDQAIEEDIYVKLEWIRKMGNKAAHDLNAVEIEDAIKAHRFIFDISVWYMEVYVSYDFVAPIYQLPKRESSATPDADQIIKPYVDKTMEKIDSLWQEVNEKLENINKEKKTVELNVNENTTEEIKKIPFPILDYLQEQNLEYLDKREKKGALWIIGDWSIHEKLNPLKKHRMYFRFTKKGGKSTGYKPAWFLLNKSLPLVDATEIGVKRTDDEKNTKEFKGKEKINLFIIEPVEYDYWTDKGQIRFPRNLEYVNLPEASPNGISYLKDRWNITRFSDITEDVLRELYKQSRTHFFDLIEELYIFGFRFAGKLASFQNGPTLKNDSQIIANEFSREMASIFSPQILKRFEMYQINSVKELDKKLLSTMSWMLKEEPDQIISFLKGLNIDGESTFEVSENKKDSEKEHPSAKDEQTGNEQCVLYLQQEMLTVSEAFAKKKLKELDIQGCNNMLARLKRNGIHCLQDMPTYLDGIHRQLKSVGERTVFKFWDEIKKFGDIETATQASTDGNLVIRYEQNHITIPEEIKNKEMKLALFPANIFSTLEVMTEAGIVRFSDLPMDLLYLKNLPGVGKVRIKNLFRSLEHVVKQIHEDEKIKQLSDEELFQYELTRYVNWYDRIKTSTDEQKKFRIPSQYIELVQKRYNASLEGEHLTLEQLGNERGITRERIRQILQKGDKKLLENWERLMTVLTRNLSDDNEIILADEIDDMTESHYLLIHGLEEHGYYYSKINTRPILTTKSKRELNEYFGTLKHDVKEVLSKRVITPTDLEEFSKERALEDGSPYEIIQAVTTKEINWLSEDQGITKSMTKADIVEMVMLQYPNGVEIYKREPELIAKANDLLPGGFKGERSFNPIVGRDDLNETFYMWGRGKAIHANFVSVNNAWIESVIQLAASWLDEEEFFHIRKLYEAVETEATKQGVPNEYALYSIMRVIPQKKLSLQRFPNVVTYGEDILENNERLINFMKEKARPVSVNELSVEFIENKGWKRFTLDMNLANTAEIIPYKHAVYTLASEYEDIEKEDLQFIISKLKTMMSQRQFIYFPSFFKENEMYLKSIGIPTSYVLYGLLSAKELIGIEFPRFPYVISDEFEGDSLTINDIVEGLIKEENRIVAREEVSFWLNELIGEGNRILDLVLLRSRNIFYYSRGRYGEYIHRDTIQMNEDATKKILDIVDSEFGEIKHNLNRDYAYISELFKPEKLPVLPASIKWNEELFGDILKKSDEWLIFGSLYALFTPMNDGIPNETAFIEAVIQEQFDGAAKLTEIRSYLKEIRYSKDGDFLSEVNEAIEQKEAPFVIEGDELIHKNLVEGNITE